MLMYAVVMTNESDRGRNKEPVTIRLDGGTRADLQALASERKRTVSSLIDEAVRTFLDQQLGRAVGDGKLRVRYALLPDTAVLHSFAQFESKRFGKVVADAGLPEFEFVPRPAEWRSLSADVFSGKSDIVEAVNRLPIHWHLTRGLSSPPLDWIGPYLTIFVGHCIFLRRDHLTEFLSDEEIADFIEFRSQARSGKDWSLRSLTAWAARSEDSAGRAAKLSEAWQNAIVGCQLGTDFHIAVRRVSAALAALAWTEKELAVAAPREPNPVGIESLERGIEEFRSGSLSAFTGSLLQSAELLSDGNDEAFLIAGPADVRVPSLNTLAGRKGMFDVEGPASAIGVGVLKLWREAVSWFRDEVVMGEPEVLKQLVEENFPRAGGRSPDQIELLRSLMQSWVRWFVDPKEAEAFMEKETVDLVRHYHELCECLHPAARMPAPDGELTLWKFPFLPGGTGPRLIRTA
ncbi:hypothetical protein BV97_01123 [Novosphingobium resinovorum]|uniref:Uncharacterized protein n=1 Tax=Novosphingobium resinovorum TaxID=158500 RepID=A0A031K3W7_9SPHN|nr:MULTISPECIES: hypothetical protein [Novosphingobium]EZP83930.1 hypothetical protein BV97_01123 [Novosphingobium resinovorum]